MGSVAIMLYGKMKKADRELSILGFGCMRLPVLESGKIDEKQAIEMIKYAIDHGINYFDTAYPYHNGDCEPFLGRALKNGLREKINLATKLPSWLIRGKEDMDMYLEEQLKRLQTDHVDFYLLHGLMKPVWENLKALKVDEFLDQAIADGRIAFAGFSFHDSVDVFKEIVDYYDWTFCQIQYNYMDENYQAGTEGLRYATDRGLGVVIMEPLRGGLLTRDLPEIRKIWAEAEVKRSPVEWGLRWVWAHPEVSVVLSGMSNLAQMRENIRYAVHRSPLTNEELNLFEKVRAKYRQKMKVNCTGCKYCLPCLSGVNIPECFNLFNSAFMFEDPDYAKFVYSTFLSQAGASKCEKCRKCQEVCPQGISIPEKLEEVAALFGK